METDKSTHPIYVIVLGTEVVMSIAYAFAKLIENAHPDQRRLVGFASNFDTVHTYKMIQQATYLARGFNPVCLEC